MPWKLSRWKACDGGCCTRSPRFPNEPTTHIETVGDGPTVEVDVITYPERPAYMAGCRYQLNEPGDTSPDGTDWLGGCVIYKELLGAIADSGQTPVSKKDIDKLTEFTKMRVIATEDSRAIDPRGALSWFQTCWQWPAPTPTLAKLRDRLTQLGLWDGRDFGIEYDTVYDDSEAEIVNGHRAIRGQTFHVEDEWDAAKRAAVESPCCHFWERV